MKARKLINLNLYLPSVFKQTNSIKTYILLFFAILSLFFVSKSFEGKIVNNSYLYGQNLGGLRVTDSKVIIDKVLTDYSEKSAFFVFQDEIVESKIKDLGVVYDSEYIIDNLPVYRSPRHIIGNLYLLLSSYFISRQVLPYYTIDADKFTEFIRLNFQGFEKKAKNALFSYKDSGVEIVNSEDGEIINLADAVLDFSLNIDELSESPVEIETISVFPEINTSELNSIANKYKSLIAKSIVFVWGFDTWKLEGLSLSKMLVAQSSKNNDAYIFPISGPRSVYLNKISDLDSGLSTVEISVDENELDSYLAKIAKVVDRPTVNATAKFDGVKITNFTPAIDGQKLDFKSTKEQIVEYISTINEETADLAVKLPVEVTSAKIDNPLINSLGIKELIGKGISYFAGSIPNRIFNVELGASRISGTLVAPGEIFSFNNTVGEVSGKTGYKQAYVISSGRTVLDDGGGICQVSTTVFRAALNAGLQIVSRTAHAYRVGYYEQKGFGPGLDATVFSPSVDFKFKNDTSRHILVQSIFNRANSMLEIDIYGTPDGRVVELGKPVITSRSPAPPELRQDDPSLPKGVVKQVDFAAEGANVYFTRKVYKKSQVLFDEVFKSNFRPWQAIYLVGTGS